MQRTFIETYSNHRISFQPRRTASGKYCADAGLVDLSPTGYQRSFSALGEFDDEEEAANFALEWVKSWIDHNRPGEDWV